MFPLRQLIRTTTWVRPCIRPMSAKAGLLTDLTVDNEGIATLTMQRPPVNSLNLDLLQELSKSLDEVAKNKAKGMILTSASPTVFSAGLDIMEMYKPDLKKAEIFWTTLQEVWLKLFGSKFITAAAINGHAPAGGCLLSMSCEYRVMVSGKFTIGLNETALGMVAPTWFMDTMCHTIPIRQAEFALTTARLFTVDEALKESGKFTIGLNETAVGIPVPFWVKDTMCHTISTRLTEFALNSAQRFNVDEALQVGLIDETASDKADAVEKCKKFIKIFDKIPPFARAATKLSIREAPISKLMKNRQQDTDTFLGFLKEAKTQQAIGMYVENLKKKAAK